MKLVFSLSVFSRKARFVGVACAGAVLLNAANAPAQNLFVSVQSSGNIFEYTPGGAQSTFATGLAYPQGLAFDSAGNLFVADGNSIYEFTPGGVRSTFAAGLSYPYGLAFNSAGDLFQTGQGGSTIYEYAPDGTRTTFASGLGYTYGLAFNSAGNLFVADAGSATIYEYTPDGTQSTFASGLAVPLGLAFNSSGNLFVSDFTGGLGTITEITPDGVQSQFAGGYLGGLGFPEGLAFNSADNLFVSDPNSANIYEYTPGGSASIFASGLGVYGPQGLAFQPVPEPSALGLLAVGAALLLVRRRKLAAGFLSDYSGN
jgi:sugar lactone lactonase YvrE